MATVFRILGIIVLVWFLNVAAYSQASQTRSTLELQNLVSSGDALAALELRFDASFAQIALRYLRSGDASPLERLAKSVAASHMLNHARNFDYDVPKDSAEALVSPRLTPPSKHLTKIDDCERTIAFGLGPMLDNPHGVADSLRYLPDDFRFQGALFLTFGYDIGLAFGPTASLNCAHSHLKAHPRELIYYAIHELRYVGFMAYQPPPRWSDLKTCGDLAGRVEYSTQSEGMAVLAAYDHRRREHASEDDGD